MNTSKPSQTLSRLEEEPETGFFGVTYSELTRALKKALLCTAVLAPMISIVIRWEAATIIAMLIAVGVFMYLVKKSSKLRADKPLFYNRHISTYKTSKFIQPAKYYQRERNHVSKESRKRV